MPCRGCVWEGDVYLWPLSVFQETGLQFSLGVVDELNSSTVVSVGFTVAWFTSHDSLSLQEQHISKIWANTTCKS